MRDLAGRVAVITGAASGFGLEFARTAARHKMKLVLGDVQEDALDAAVRELRGAGAEATSVRVDVRNADDVKRLADRALESYGEAHLLFNNAGVAGAGGYVWESSAKDWQWILGVNLMGVVHGIRTFVPIMLEQECDCHIVNTASAAGLVSAPLMGVYNVSKHAVVTLSETLHHDLRIARSRIGVSVLCPAYVPTGIRDSDRNRPTDLVDRAPPTESQVLARKQSDKAIASGKLTAAEVAQKTFQAVREDRFYVITHPKLLLSVELRLRDIVEQRAPSDPFTYKPEAKPHGG